MTNEEFAEIYKKLILRAISDSCIFKESNSAIDGVSELNKYFLELERGNEHQIVIFRCDPPQGEAAYTDGRSNCQKINELIGRNTSGLHEVIGVAHELGHHFYRDEDNKVLYKQLRDNGCLSSEENKNTVLKEEKFAWCKGREILSDLGFTRWTIFSAQEVAAITSYLSIPICSPK